MATFFPEIRCADIRSSGVSISTSSSAKILRRLVREEQRQLVHELAEHLRRRRDVAEETQLVLYQRMVDFDDGPAAESGPREPWGVTTSGLSGKSGCDSPAETRAGLGHRERSYQKVWARPRTTPCDVFAAARSVTVFPGATTMSSRRRRGNRESPDTAAAARRALRFVRAARECRRRARAHRR